MTENPMKKRAKKKNKINTKINCYQNEMLLDFSFIQEPVTIDRT